MLISFAVENFFSYRERQTLNLLAEERGELIENTIPVDAPALKGHHVLKFAAIYGANASGKSNLLLAFHRFSEIVSNSAKESTAGEKMSITSFKLDDNWAKKPTYFSVTLLIDKIVYIYDVSLTEDRIFTEELTAFPKTHPQRLFRRRVNPDGKSEWHFSRTNFRRDRALEDRTRPNSLYVSVGALFNHPQLTKISEFFSHSKLHISLTRERDFLQVISRCDNDLKFSRWAYELLSAADTGIAKVRVNTVNMPDQLFEREQRSLPDKVATQFHRTKEMQVAHVKLDGQPVWWPIGWESDGTRQLLNLLRSWYDMFDTGSLVLVDEIETSLHPLLCRKLLTWLSESKINKGQLLFTTHGSTLLDPTILRRDQIYFTEKSKDGATQLYSLLEFTPRSDEALQKGYLSGRYGAIPFFGEFKFEAQTHKKADLQKIATPA